MLASYRGVPLGQAEYQRDFGELRLGPLPELVSLSGQTLFVAHYADGVPAGPTRFTDQDLIGRYERFAAGLYASGEDLDAYFQREIAPLPPPDSGSEP